MHYSENWGGYRLGAGRKESWDTQFVGEKNRIQFIVQALKLIT